MTNLRVWWPHSKVIVQVVQEKGYPMPQQDPLKQVCQYIEQLWGRPQAKREAGIYINAILPLHC